MPGLNFIAKNPKHSKKGNWCLTIGNFDGVHLGHRHLLERTAEIAKNHSLQAGVLIFDPPPSEVLKKEGGNKMLCSQEEKIFRIQEFSIDGIFVQKFDETLAKTSAEDFMKNQILKEIDLEELIFGYDFRFGKNREGTAESLKSLPEFQNIKIRTEIPFLLNGQIVSSSLIRKHLAANEFSEAEKYLGRSWSFSGKVCPGNRQGKHLGFPTANLDASPRTPLNFGVYAVRVLRGKDRLYGVMNFGNRPTFEGRPPCFEVHIFDFDADIYGETLQVFPVRFIRDEVRFDSIDSLKARIKKDVAEAKQSFGIEVSA